MRTRIDTNRNIRGREALILGGLAAFAGCSSSSTQTPDGGSGFTPPTDPGPGGILFAASGQVLALTGYAFPPANDGDPAFIDGWQVDF